MSFAATNLTKRAIFPSILMVGRVVRPQGDLGRVAGLEFYYGHWTSMPYLLASVSLKYVKMQGQLWPALSKRRHFSKQYVAFDRVFCKESSDSDGYKPK